MTEASFLLAIQQIPICLLLKDSKTLERSSKFTVPSQAQCIICFGLLGFPNCSIGPDSPTSRRDFSSDSTKAFHPASAKLQTEGKSQFNGKTS
ncbi:Uncharacterized protein TCM_041533 [Theobroma cacao]|uniref:Uncharacterized protein n=1 Tax=Theobroma cacao TaxID=3641 RepID=A0A061GW13_THECC|nr:Uncharacterized protein TCM_041533 [Theobroma cacao]